MGETISVKDAVQKAFDYVRELIPKDQLNNLLLEEVDYDEYKNEWLITVGFDSFHYSEEHPLPSIFSGTSAAAIAEKRIQVKERFYKVLRIDGSDGSVKSMKIRSDV